ncbi:MAG TPA: glycine oxidase ThiO [Acidimicrobiales bacterium]|nr:glycine oxidase ThiO [Acidimicrobiales bacterium]
MTVGGAGRPEVPVGGYDAVVVGGGTIGLTSAWRMAARGMQVAVADPEPGRGASWVAAGMLAPVTEVHYTEERLVALTMASAGRWPSFASELEADAGVGVGYRACGTLVVDVDDGDRAWSDELYRFQCSLGLDVERLNARAVRALEPNVAPGLRSGILARGDHQVQTRRFVTALCAAATARGVQWHRAAVTAVEVAGGAVRGVHCDGTFLRAPVVVLAAGCWSGSITGLPDGVVPPVRPVKGQILRLKGDPRSPLLERSVRGVVGGSSVYLVPRADGGIVVGATVEERGFDTTVTAGAVYELLRDARRVVPGVTELELVEARAGLRPGSPDNAPIVGASAVDGLVLATGHYRNGILLSPLTADAVAAVATGGEPPLEMAPFTPARFTPARFTPEVARP